MQLANFQIDKRGSQRWMRCIRDDSQVFEQEVGSLEHYA
jgi:hypothetical protein